MRSKKANDRPQRLEVSDSNREQQQKLGVQFGQARTIYNWGLAQSQDGYPGYTGPCEFDFPGQTGYIFSLDAKTIVGDGGGVIRVWQWDGARYAGPRLLCRHDSSMHIQQTHPHPRISSDGQFVVFSYDRTGYGNLYAVPLGKFGSLPVLDE